MVQWARWLFILPLIFGMQFTQASGQKATGPPRKVLDDARMFSDAAKAKANAKIAELKQRFNKDYFVETVSTVQRPAGLNPADKSAVARFFDEWATERFKNHKVNGVYAVIVEKPPIYRVAVGPTTRRIGLFTSANRQELQKIMLANLKAGKKDEALVEGAEYVLTTMTANAKSMDANKTKRSSQEKTNSGWPSWMGMVCIGLVVLLGIWLVVGVVRAFSGGGGGGNGPGGGYGGGGFFSSLLGGLFGAMAGMWLYNNLFGGDAHAADSAMDSAPADQPADDYGAEAGQDADVGGGDYGDGDWDDKDRFDGDDWGDDGDFGGGDWGGDFGGGDW